VRDCDVIDLEKFVALPNDSARRCRGASQQLVDDNRSVLYILHTCMKMMMVNAHTTLSVSSSLFLDINISHVFCTVFPFPERLLRRRLDGASRGYLTIQESIIPAADTCVGSATQRRPGLHTQGGYLLKGGQVAAVFNGKS